LTHLQEIENFYKESHLILKKEQIEKISYLGLERVKRGRTLTETRQGMKRLGKARQCRNFFNQNTRFVIPLIDLLEHKSLRLIYIIYKCKCFTLVSIKCFFYLAYPPMHFATWHSIKNLFQLYLHHTFLLDLKASFLILILTKLIIKNKNHKRH